MSLRVLKEYVGLVLSEKIHNISKNKFNLEEFKKLKSYKDMLDYADKSLTKLGEGSSRTVYALSGTKVLKIANYQYGYRQNKFEFNVFTNHSTRNIVAKIFDHADDFSWLISELTRPLKNNEEFRKLIGLNFNSKFPNSFLDDPEFFIRKIHLDNSEDNVSIEEYYKDNSKVIKFAHSLKDFFDNSDIAPDEAELYWQWGKTPDGRLVLIDSGYSKSD